MISGMNLEAIQAALREAGLDGWLFYDHHHRDPIGERILGLDPKAHITRRWYYFIPAQGEPRKLVHRIEQGRLDTLPGRKGLYSSWQELAAGLEAMLTGATRLAMQYSPNNAIMYVSMVDAGTVEFLRTLGKEIVSSADLVSQFEAVLTDEQIASHAVAQKAIDAILAEGWRKIARSLRPASGKPVELTEFDMVQWLSATPCAAKAWSGRTAPTSASTPTAPTRTTSPPREHTAPIRDGDFPPHRHLGPRRQARQPSTTTSPGPASSAASPPSASSSSSTPSATPATPPSPPSSRPSPPGPAHPRLRGRRRRPRRHSRRRLRRILHPPHRPQHRPGDSRPRRAPRQSRDPRRAPAPAQHLLLRRARHLPAGVRRAQRGRHADRPRQGVGHGKDAARAGSDLVWRRKIRVKQ